jgi:hypothetical protein
MHGTNLFKTQAQRTIRSAIHDFRNQLSKFSGISKVQVQLNATEMKLESVSSSEPKVEEDDYFVTA